MQTISRRNAVPVLALAMASMPVIMRQAVAADGGGGWSGADAAPLAISGYDPVAYFVAGRPTPGLPEFEMEYDRRLYRFASADNLARFRADPAHYAPQFRGQCALDLADGKVSPVVPEAWLIRDGKLYLFGDLQGPSLFQDHYAANVSRAQQNRSRIPAQ